jgi:hypothetical protein
MKLYRWLAVLPTLGMLGGLPFANRVNPYVFGMPFLLAWIVAWVIATSIIMAVIYQLDRARDTERDGTVAAPSLADDDVAR